MVKTKGTATEKAMAELHKLVADFMSATLKKGGEAITPAFLAVVTKFLKDNGIETDAELDTTMNSISANLPSLDDMDEETFARQ